MKKVKKLLGMITLMTMTSTLLFQPEINAAVINETQENVKIEGIEATENTDSIETTENTDSIEAVKKYEEELKNGVYTEKEASSTALSILSFTSDLRSPQEKGKTIKLTARAQGGSGTLQYSFVMASNGHYREIKAYSTTNTVSWKPEYVETYKLYAVVKDSTGKMEISSINYEIKAVSAPVITNFKADKPSPQSSGTSIKLTANATGAGTLQYKFLMNDSNSNWFVIKDYSTSNTATWTAGKVGNKTLYVDVKDGNGKVTRKQIAYKIVEPLKVTSFKADKPSPQVKGTSIKLTANATGAGTLQYKFLISDPNSNWFVIKNYSTSNTAMWTAGTAGNKTLYVDVKDGNGRVARKQMAYKVVNPLKINSFTADKPSPQVKGTSVKLTANASGTGTLQYKFLISDSNSNWFVLKNYSTSNTFVWTASIPGNKTLSVDVKDGNGQVVRKQMAYKVVEPLKINSFTADKPSPQTSGTNIKLKVNATGVGTLQYKYLIKDSAGKWYVIKNFSTSNEIVWTAGNAGNKTFYVDVKDSTGKIVRKEMSYTIKSPIKVTGEVVEADGDTNSTNNTALSNATVKITKGNVTQTTKTDANGAYSFGNLLSGNYTITVSKNGYITVTQTLNVPDGQAIYYNSTIELISNASTANGTASGTIYDVLTGNGVEGLTLKIRTGIGNTTGTVIKTVKTGTDGKYSVALPTGNYCVQIVDERTLPNESQRYLTNTFDIKTIGDKTISSQDGNVSTAISAQQVRIVLKWGEYPRDLDSHLVGPTSNGSKFHVYFSNKSYYEENSQKVADLDLDDTSSYGPETTTIYNPISGKYQFYVHDYSNKTDEESSELSKSGATVQVYVGASNRPLYTFNVPKKEGTLWKVFEYDSVTKKITPINQMSYECYSGDVGEN